MINYRNVNLTLIFSIAADCPCDVKSMMTSQRASVRGVNCPWVVGVTIQSSISPRNNTKKNNKLDFGSSAHDLQHIMLHFSNNCAN